MMISGLVQELKTRKRETAVRGMGDTLKAETGTNDRGTKRFVFMWTTTGVTSVSNSHSVVSPRCCICLLSHTQTHLYTQTHKIKADKY